ncbi:MAG: YHS domain-containing protein [Rhodobacteraceae bacterium]|nr:YHS domain-containing protein [Paracoccaceae bacterium]
MTFGRPTLQAALLAAALLSTGSLTTFAQADEVSSFVTNGTAIGGTDPVAYFTQGKPVQGSDEFTATYDDVTWKFSSSENRDLFIANPSKYAPQFGGFCAFGVSKGYKVPIVPEAWSIVEGKLYLNNSLSVQERFQSNSEELIDHARLNWEIVKDKRPEDITSAIIR